MNKRLKSMIDLVLTKMEFIKTEPNKTIMDLIKRDLTRMTSNIWGLISKGFISIANL